MSIVIIPDFHELRLPMCTGDSNWYTFDLHEKGLFYLLNQDRYQLCDLGEIDILKISDNLYFNSEEECHRAAAGYYTTYTTTYPYTNEWLASMPPQAPTNNQPLTTEVESQIMVFT